MSISLKIKTISFLTVFILLSGCSSKSFYVKTHKNIPGIPIISFNVIVDTETSTHTRDFETAIKPTIAKALKPYGIETKYLNNQSIALESRPLVQFAHAFLIEDASHVLYIDLKDIDNGIYSYAIELMAWDKSKFPNAKNEKKTTAENIGMATVYKSRILAIPKGFPSSGTWQGISQQFTDQLMSDLKSSGVLKAATVSKQ